MIRTFNYEIFRSYPQLYCASYWRDREESDAELSLAELSFFQKAAVARAEQVHGAGIRPVKYPGMQPDCDGLISSEADLALLIRTADCAPLMFFHPGNNVIANVHAGWRGIHAGIVDEAIRQLSENFNSPAAGLRIAVGTFIRECCYEVGPEFGNYFPPEFFVKNNGKQHLNLQAALQHSFLRNGIDLSLVEFSGECTCCSRQNFPSYRRNHTKDRILNLIVRSSS
ncbi:MAG: polyphenol oxidase family protein [Calditrichia bacterium]